MNMLEAIETRLTQNKSAVKTYKTADAATKAAEKEIADFFASQSEFQPYPPKMFYVVTYIPSNQRFTVIFNTGRWFAESGRGGYVSHFAERGFFCM